MVTRDESTSRLIIGTASWGSKVSVGHAIDVGLELVESGFTHFDTAPTYGAGYAHLALRRIATRSFKPISVDTKFGQLNDRSPRGFAKKLLRAPNLTALSNALRRDERTDRDSAEFWIAQRCVDSLSRSMDDLSPAVTKRVYLHSPPVAVWASEYKALREAIEMRPNACRLTVGISEPVRADLEALIEGFDSKRVCVQLTLRQLLENLERLASTENLDLCINGLFRDQAYCAMQLGLDERALQREVASVLKAQPTWKVIVGINQPHNVKRLSQVAEDWGLSDDDG